MDKHNLMAGEIHPSVGNIWNDFIEVNGEYKNYSLAPSWYFCDNEKDAIDCADLVVKKIKRATSTSLWWYQKHNMALPKIGDINIVTDWNGVAKAIIKTSNVEEVTLKDISREYAAIEGEGDKSLEYWRKVHWDYYTREMEPFGEAPSVDMIIVCEEFETIWPD